MPEAGKYELEQLELQNKETRNTTSPQNDAHIHSPTINTELSEHGIVELKGYGSVSIRARAKFLKIQHNFRKFDQLWNFMEKTWKMKVPDIILSVNGAAEFPHDFNETCYRNLVTGIRNLIDSSKNIWIITLGFDKGVARIVGEAIKSEIDLYMDCGRVCCIGICTWGQLMNREELLKETQTNEKTYIKPQPDNSRKCIFEPHHTHFILCDDGKEDFGADCNFRGSFESYLHKKMMDEKTEGLVSPVIQIVISGGKNTIKTANKALKSGTPVAFVEGTGKAADLIPIIVRKIEKLTKWEDIQSAIELTFDAKAYGLRELEIKTWQRYIMEMVLGFRKKILIVKDNELQASFDRLILQAIYKEYKSHRKLLDWVMKMDRLDIAKQEIFGKQFRQEDIPNYNEVQFLLIYHIENENFEIIEKKSEIYSEHAHELFLEKIKHHNKESFILLDQIIVVQISSDKETLRPMIKYCQHMIATEKYQTIEILMESGCVDPMPTFNFEIETLKLNDLFETFKTAILLDSVDFVNSHMENGVDVQSFLKCNTLKSLYESANKDICPAEFSKSFFQTIMKSKLYCRGYWRTDITGDDVLIKAGELLTHLADGAFPNPYSDAEANSRKIYTVQDLFFFCLLSQRYQLAIYFSKFDKNPIAAALIGLGVMRSLKWLVKRRGERERLETVRGLKRSFSQMAIDILNEAKRKDHILARIMVTSALPHYGNQDCMSLANIFNCKDFLHNEVCQTKIVSLWRGAIAYDTHGIAIFVGILIPFVFIPLIFTGRRNTIEDTVEHSTDDIKSDTRFIDDSDYLSFKVNEVKQNERTKIQLKQGLHYFESVKLFYQAPITKYFLYILSYLFFLGMYTYVTLVSLQPCCSGNQPFVLEYFVWLWFIANVIEELRVVFSGYHATRKTRAKQWFSSAWHSIDVFIFTFFIIISILRLTLDKERFLKGVQYPQSILLSLFYLRFLRFYYSSKILGPKIIMIFKMIINVFFFLLIYGTVLLAYGTLIQKYEHKEETKWNILKNVFYFPYWQTFGMSDKDEFDENEVTMVASVIFQWFTNILLLNLLIAMFENTYQKVQSTAEKVWAYHLYDLVYEFKRRTWAPPPFSLLFSCITACLRSKCGKNGKKEKTRHAFTMELNQEESNYVSFFANICMESYLNNNKNKNENSEENDQSSTEAHLLLSSTADKVAQLDENVKKLTDMVELLLQKIDQ